MATIITEINEAAAVLKNDAVVAIPTETVYGLAGNIYSLKAVEQIFTIKKRPFYNPLIVHIASIHSLHKIVTEIPEKAFQLAEAFWSGPLTLVLKKKSSIPDIVTGGKDTVAVRVPNHPLTLSLLAELDFPLAAPSANPFGTISPTTATHVASYFEKNNLKILDGGVCEKGVESTIVGFKGERPIVYRHGAITIEQIEAIVGKVEINSTHSSTAPDAPGMLLSHYAPKTPALLTTDIEKTIEQHSGKKIGILAFRKINLTNKQRYNCEILSIAGSLDEASFEFYAALHRLDKQALDLIIMEKFPDMGLGKTINDRMQRASITL